MFCGKICIRIQWKMIFYNYKKKDQNEIKLGSMIYTRNRRGYYKDVL